MNGAFPLLALDVGMIIGIVIVIIAVLGQILSKLKEVQQPPPQQQRRPQPPVRPPRAGGAAGGAAPGKPNPLEDEIRQFLRGAAERRAAPGAERPKPIGPPRQQRPPQPAPVAERPPLSPLRPEEPEVVVAEVSSLSEPLGREEFAELPSAIKSKVAQADDKMESHLHEVFDHKLGTLDKGSAMTGGLAQSKPPGEPEPAGAPLPTTAAAGLAAMFATVENIRTAVLVNEILQRPEHRWE